MSLPEGWEEKRFDQFGTIFSGSTPSTSIASFWDGEIVWITPADLSKLATHYLHHSEKRITQKGLNGCSTHLLPVGSVVMSSRAPIGYVALPTVPFCTNQGCKTIKLKNGFDSEFTYYNILFNIEKVKNLGEGTTFAEISKTALETVVLTFPTDPLEQASIAEVLSTVDRAIEQTETLIAKQERIKTGLMQDLLTRGIDEQGNIRSESSHQFKDTPLGRLPVEWESGILKDKCLRITDGVHQTVTTSEEGIPFLYVSCIRDGRILWHKTARIPEALYRQISRGCEPVAGVVLYTVVGSYGFAANVESDSPFSFQRHIAYLKPNPNELHSVFLAAWLNSPFMRLRADQSALGNAQKTITLGELSTFPVPCPKMAEQERIVEQVQRHECAVIAAEDALRKLRSLKTGLMQDLLTGRKRVTSLLEMEPTR